MKFLSCLCCCIFVLQVHYCSAQVYYYMSDNPDQISILHSFAGFNQRVALQNQVTTVASEPFAQYAFNSNNALNGYFPFLYNSRTRSFGLSDVRMKYTRVIKRNISNHFVSLQGGLQVNCPTGPNPKGLGSGRWVIQPSVTGLFRFSQNCVFVPSASYQHYVNYYPKSHTPYSTHGIGMQALVYVRVKGPLFLSSWVNYSHVDANPQGSTANTSQVSGQLAFFYVFRKLQVNAGWSPSIMAKIHTFSAGFVLYRI